jgi:hypothetical protein
MWVASHCPSSAFIVYFLVDPQGPSSTPDWPPRLEMHRRAMDAMRKDSLAAGIHAPLLADFISGMPYRRRTAGPLPERLPSLL